MKPISLHALAKLLHLHHPDKSVIQGFAVDSRKVVPGDLFFALPGAQVDGHAFLEEAAARGAIGAVVKEEYRGAPFKLPLLHVPDVLQALQDLARKSLKKRKSRVIAITGSLGKTTTKVFAAKLLASQYSIFATPLSYNSKITLPLSLLMADENAEYLLLEMGMTHKGEIEKLLSIAPPEIAMITTVAVQHASNFPDGLAGISREKGAIFSHPKTEIGILHRDIHHFEEVKQIGKCPKITFSLTNRESDYFLEQIPEGVCIYTKEERVVIPLQLPVRAHYQNFLAAVVLARLLEIPWEVIQKVAPTLKLPPMRFERVERGGIIFINDAYNANPDSIKAALENLPPPNPGGKVIAVLSEMDALGMYSEGGHSLVAETALQYADYLLCLGGRCETMQKIWKREKKPVELFQSRGELECALKKIVREGDVVLLKGARAYALDQILHQFT